MFKRDTEIYNLSDPGTKALLKQRVDEAEGLKCFHLGAWNPPATMSQRGYWYAVVLPALVEFFHEGTGNSAWNAESCHYFARESWLDVVVTELPSGQMYRRPRSTSELDTGEYSKLIDSAINWMGDFGKKVPLPSRFERENNDKQTECARGNHGGIRIAGQPKRIVTGP